MAFQQNLVDAPRHPVRSEPLKDGKPEERRRAPAPGLWPLALVLLVFGAIGWVAGGKYTVEGWVTALNMFGRWVGVGGTLNVPRGVLLIAVIAALSLLYSRVELMVYARSAHRLPLFWIGWLLIVMTDIGSTLIGVLNPPEDAAPVMLQVASLPPVAIVFSLILTFIPEWLILGGAKLLRR